MLSCWFGEGVFFGIFGCKFSRSKDLHALWCSLFVSYFCCSKCILGESNLTCSCITEHVCVLS